MSEGMSAGMTMSLQTWRGFSAYEIAVQNGYAGTEAEWLESLRGAPGQNGTEVTVNNRAAVDANITVRGTDIYVKPGLATTVAQALDDCLRRDQVADSLESADAQKALSAAKGALLHQEVQQRAKAFLFVVTLPAGGWTLAEDETYVQTVAAQSLTADASRTAAVVSPLPDRAQEENYTACGVRAVSQGDGTLTFSALELPQDDIGANVMVVEVAV